uniref:ARAD1D05874p n=1 Tax=Blastobotrys adeninivorans TaxID=409370 RepID=A0A060T7X8_BLAAD
MPRVAQRDRYARVSFLYQGAVTAMANNYGPLARAYGYTLKSVAKKNVLRLSPHIKRSLCKKCSQLLIPGVSCSVRVQGEGKGQTLVVACQCGKRKNFQVGKDPNYVPWFDRTESISYDK